MTTHGYRHVADELRSAIERGDYPVGATIPKEHELADQYGLSRDTIRRATALLRREGLIAPVRRRGTIVRDRTLVELPMTRYADATPDTGPWETACAQQGLNGWTDVLGVSLLEAPRDVAEELRLPPGAPVIRRENRMRIGDQAAQLQETWLPYELLSDTPLARPEKVVGGIYRGLTDAGHRPGVARETVTGRPPTEEESDALCLDTCSAVLEVRRTTYGANDLPLAYVHIVVAGDRVSLVYRQVLES